GAIGAGALMAVFLANSGGSWDNAKKIVEDGNFGGKGSDAHAATVIGDTVGDPFKDTAGPSINPLIKVMNLVSLLIAPAIVQLSVGSNASAGLLDEPLAALTLAFVLGRPVPRARLAAALPRLGVAGAVRAGLVETAGEGPQDAVRAVVDLRPYAAVDAARTADWWVVSDVGELATGRPLRPDHVLGVGGASVTLARCTIRAPVARVLDLGTGCGVQALHAGR